MLPTQVLHASTMAVGFSEVGGPGRLNARKLMGTNSAWAEVVCASGSKRGCKLSLLVS